MKILMRLSAVALALGMLGAAACSSCSQPPDDATSNSTIPQTSYRCGAGTVLQNNQCVATTTNRPTTQTTTASSRPTTLSTSGNN